MINCELLDAAHMVCIAIVENKVTRTFCSETGWPQIFDYGIFFQKFPSPPSKAPILQSQNANISIANTIPPGKCQKMLANSFD
jgi:hypothetical protein